jgi:hypothetical protein
VNLPRWPLFGFGVLSEAMLPAPSVWQSLALLDAALAYARISRHVVEVDWSPVAGWSRLRVNIRGSRVERVFLPQANEHVEHTLRRLVFQVQAGARQVQGGLSLHHAFALVDNGARARELPVAGVERAANVTVDALWRSVKGGR